MNANCVIKTQEECHCHFNYLLIVLCANKNKKKISIVNYVRCNFNVVEIVKEFSNRSMFELWSICFVSNSLNWGSWIGVPSTSTNITWYIGLYAGYRNGEFSICKDIPLYKIIIRQHGHIKKYFSPDEDVFKHLK